MRYDDEQIDARLFKRGRRYWMWGYDADGKRWWESTKQTTRSAARTAGKLIDERRAKPIVPPDPIAQAAGALTLEKLFVELHAEGRRRNWKPKTVKFKANCIRHLLDKLGRTTLAASFADADAKIRVNEYVDARLAEGNADTAQRHTIFKELQLLIQGLRHAEGLGLFAGNASKLMPESFKAKKSRYRPSTGWLCTLAECDALIAAFEELFPGRGLEVVAYLNLGVRHAELWAFKPGDVHELDMPGKAYLQVHGTKTEGAERKVSLNATMVEVLRRKLADAAWNAPVFEPQKNLDRDLKQAWRQARFRLLTAAPDARERSKLDATLPKSLCANDLRRTFVSMLCRAGVPSHACADLLGHKSTEMVMSVYRQVDPQSLHDAVARMPAMALPAAPAEAAVTKPVTGKARKTGLAA